MHMLSCNWKSWSFRDLLFENWTRNLSIASKFYSFKSILLFLFICSKRWHTKKLVKWTMIVEGYNTLLVLFIQKALHKNNSSKSVTIRHLFRISAFHAGMLLGGVEALETSFSKLKWTYEVGSTDMQCCYSYCFPTCFTIDINFFRQRWIRKKTLETPSPGQSLFWGLTITWVTI